MAAQSMVAAGLDRSRKACVIPQVLRSCGFHRWAPLKLASLSRLIINRVITCSDSSFNLDNSSKLNKDLEIKLKHKVLLRALMVAASVIFVSAWGAAGAVADDIKVGVVDTERILAESAPAVRALKKIEKEFLPRDQEIKRMALEAKELQDLLEKEGKSMP